MKAEKHTPSPGTPGEGWGEGFVIRHLIFFRHSKFVIYLPAYQNARLQLCARSFCSNSSLIPAISLTPQFNSACLTFLIPGITVETALGLSANFSAAVASSFSADPTVSFTFATRLTVLSSRSPAKY